MINSQSYDAFCEFLDSACGIVLGANKEYLVNSRLRAVFEENGLESLDQLLEKLKFGNHMLRQKVVDAMTTNETLWFRDDHPFKYFKDELLEQLYSVAGARKPRIWSAACSSGQEPYSLSICANEFAKAKPLLGSRGLDIVATDISSSILDVARKGEYDQLALNRGMSKERLEKYFDQGAHNTWTVKPNIKQSIQFKSLNLQDSYIALGGKLDMIFCRNVLIYFSPENKRQILEKMHAQLRPKGYLMLGASESIGPAGELFNMIQYRGGIVYQAK
ncbi:chemotaxis protein [Oleiphilus sp. HI0009]|uniref:CheR family methyltransferase n=1 Tax=unclassified Oleiphilus TaxID=2631174 RepID=UPI0007C3F87F|nr:MULTISPECIES: protein-glutamate O-methyltransferase CheR [unclassified Oleiphilus]KZX82133.1 chemotaxis protein [Oleiphilus sp. HI0009]KZY66377.1 chemotaxis protein [Oleiphilus sp. HI0066]KZY71279.1 chemotaxis protein [Oleiphilus sp. HI0067]MCH2157867.1 protein-glutamate O-methyltransferase CheR [Oleiphilaceae bacterium]